MKNWADFEWNIINRVFTMDVFQPFSYSGVNSLICQGWGGRTIMITHNEKSNKVRISFPDKQIVVNGLDEAYQQIVEWRNN